MVSTLLEKENRVYRLSKYLYGLFGTTAGLIPNLGYVGSRIDAANVDPFEDHVGDVWNYSRLDPNLGVRRQSNRCSQCGSF